MTKMIQLILFIGLFLGVCAQDKEVDSLVLNNSVLQEMNIDTLKFIKEVDNKVKIIDSQESDYKKEEKTLHGEPSEGGHIIAYYNGTVLKKLKESFYGSMGNNKYEYYFIERNTVFIKKQEFTYNKPMYMEGSKVISVRESKYYFYNDSLLFWEDYDGDLISTNSKKFKEENNYLLDDIWEFKNLQIDSLPANKPIILGDTIKCKFGSKCQRSGYIIKGSRSKGRVIHVKPPINKNVPIEQ